MIRNSKVTVTYSKYRMIPAELQGHDTSDEDEDEYFTQDDARIELPTKLRESFIISAANRLIGEVVQSRRRPLLGPSPG